MVHMDENKETKKPADDDDDYDVWLIGPGPVAPTSPGVLQGASSKQSGSTTEQHADGICVNSYSEIGCSGDYLSNLWCLTF